VAIVLGQLAWNMALKYARASELSLATAFSPLAAPMPPLAAAIIGDIPEMAWCAMGKSPDATT
jgi:drug/metabolite transporter (DMT)-like permease|tara:strand:- start:94 stop:282 length:189 start_codon:yes stop_codon:yes gene_type:complete